MDGKDGYYLDGEFHPFAKSPFGGTCENIIQNGQILDSTKCSINKNSVGSYTMNDTYISFKSSSAANGGCYLAIDVTDYDIIIADISSDNYQTGTIQIAADGTSLYWNGSAYQYGSRLDVSEFIGVVNVCIRGSGKLYNVVGIKSN